MLEALETYTHEIPDLLVVINAKDIQGALPFGLRRGALAGSMVDFNAAGVAWRHFIYGRCVHVKSGFVDL
jgi:hypothetical protein